MSETTTDRLAEIEAQAEPQPVQVREGRWRTRGGHIRNIIPTPGDQSEAGRCSWRDAYFYQTWYPSGQYSLTGEHPLDLLEYLGPNLPEPEKIITPDDVAAEALAGVWDKAKAEQEIAELRSEVSYVQGLLGESRKAVNSADRDNADLQHRLDVVSSEWAVQAETIRGLETQLEAVKAELVQVSKDRQALQIELDAYELRSHNVSDRFEEGWDKGTAQAVETIAEWLEPLRQMIEKADNLVESDRASRLCAEIMQSLPAIMRNLTGLIDED